MSDKLKLLDLFSGIGGFSLALEATGQFETVAFCEFDKHAQEILKLRWPDVPIFEDIREINEPVKADIITGGFPCQPFSVAGKRDGKDDNRYLWPELLRVIQLVKPTWCILENVRGLLTIEDGVVFGDCLSDLEAACYEHQTLVIPACAKNAQHRRDRIWIVAHPKQFGRGGRGNGDEGRRGREIQVEGSCPPQKRKNVADTINEGLQGSEQSKAFRQSEGPSRPVTQCGENDRGNSRSTKPRLGREPDGLSHWLDEQGLPKVSKGVPGRTERLKQLGNSIVPQIAYEIGMAILETENDQPR